MKIVYFVSSKYPYDTVIYPGVGPHYARMFGWPVATFEQMADTDCDAGVIDNRTLPADHAFIDGFLARSTRRFPLFFKLSDPDMPTYAHETARYVFDKKDAAGVHYISIYDLEGPLREFARTLKRSRVLHLRFPYDRSREIGTPFEHRRRRVLLSGAYGRELYPLRSLLRRQRRTNPLLRLAVSNLAHPGYPESGQPRRHDITFARFIEHAARFTHFFLCPSRYRVELMKFSECAYAGCVPIGEAPNSLRDEVGDCFVTYSGHALQLVKELTQDRDAMLARATEYRRIMRVLRDPVRLVARFEEEIATVL